MIEKTYQENKEDYLDFLAMIVQTDTQVIGHGVDGGNEINGQKIVKKKLEELGLEIDEFLVDDEKIGKYPGANLNHKNENRPNIVGTLKGSGGGKSLILNGHIDTMPYGDRESWKHDPFLGEVIDGKLYGLGSVDMKASLVAMIAAVDVIVNSGVQLKGDLILQSVVDEEGGGNGTLAAVERGYKADGAIVGEPTSLNIQPAHMGFLFHEIKVKGKSLHSSQLWNGVNAIEKAMNIFSAIKDLERQWLMTIHHPLLPGPTVNLGVIEGGTAGSVVPDQCTIKTCLHYPPVAGEDYSVTRERINDEFLHAIDLVVRGDDWLSENPPKVTVYQEGFPFETPVDHEVVKAMEEIVKDYKEDYQVEGMAAGCDARLLSGFAETPTIIIGAGPSKAAHTIDESVPVDEFYQLIQIYVDFIIDWCGVN